MSKSAESANQNESVVLAIDAGGTCFKSALVGNAGTILPGSFYQSPVCSSGTEDVVLTAYEDIIRHGSYCAKEHGVSIRGIGVATPGPFDYKHGISLMKHKFACLYGISLRDRLKERLPETAGLPFCFRHDANSFLAGEIWQGAAQGYSRIGGVTLGTGIGMACCIEGEFINNELGSPMPEVSVWNQPYRDGIVEDYVSARALIAAYQRKNPRYDPGNGAKGIADAAKAGEQAAMKVYDQFGADLGHILTPWCERFAPEIIVFGGQIAKDFDLFAPAVGQQLRSGAAALPRLVPGSLGNNAALYGVATQLTDARPALSRSSP